MMLSKNSAVKNYVILGPPGSGKSTQAEELRKKHHLAHIDIGSELRAAAETDTPFGRALHETINVRRELASDEIMQKVFHDALERIPKATGILLDGAPRRESQIDEVEKAFQDSGREISRVFYITIPEEVSIHRIARRYRCFGCHRPYILGKDLADPAKPCTVCGGRIGQRKDDTPAGVKKRYHIFLQETLPVIEHFRKKNQLREIDGTQGAEVISQELFKNVS